MDGPYRVMDYDMNPESVGLVDFSGEVCTDNRDDACDIDRDGERKDGDELRGT